MKIIKSYKTKMLLIIAILCALVFLLVGANMTSQSASAASIGESTVAIETESDNVMAVAAAAHPTASAPYLDIRIIGKSGGTWTIKVTNNNSYQVEVIYNKTMCFLGDAEKWTLNNTDSFMLGAGQSTSATNDTTAPDHAKISQNLWADYIAISFVYSSPGYRYISYAKDLNINTSMSAFYTSISA